MVRMFASLPPPPNSRMLHTLRLPYLSFGDHVLTAKTEHKRNFFRTFLKLARTAGLSCFKLRAVCIL